MKKSVGLALACAATVLGSAVPAAAATVISYDVYHPSIPLAPFSQSFTTAVAGTIDGSFTELSTYDSVPVQVWIQGPSGTFDFVTTFASRALTTGILAPTVIAAGTYTLHFSDLDADEYKGTVNFTALPAPEPETWALMFLGFGVVGAAMRSRSTKKRAIA